MAGAGGGIAIAGANMWALLRNNDPGHSADDAVVHGRKLVRKAAAKAEEVAPPPRAESVAKAKPATKRGSKKGTKKATKRGAAVGGKHEQAAPAGTMDDMMERFTRIAMAAIYGKQMPLEAPPAVPAIPGLLPEHQPGGGEAKETPAAAAPSKEEEEVVGVEWEYEEMGKVEEEGEFVAVVAKGGTVARRRGARKAAAADGATAAGANMWTVLGDDDPGHGAAYGRKNRKAAAEVEEETALADNVDVSACSGSGDGGAKPAKRGKKTKKKKKKCAVVEAEGRKQTATMDDGEVKAKDKKQAVAVTVDTGKVTTQDNKLPSKGEMSEDEEEIAGGCGAVGRAVVAAAVIALWCRLVSPF